MISGKDTAKRDWLILIIGLLAGAWFFFDYGTHHPISQADASLGKEAAVSLGTDVISDLGYSQTDLEYISRFATRETLLDYIQQQTGFRTFFADNARSSAFPVYHWRVDLVSSAEDPDTPDNDIEQRDFDDLVTMTLTFSQGGEWLEFKNPNNRRPHRLLSAEVINHAFDLPGELLFAARSDSVALANFAFEFDRVLPDDTFIREDGVIQIGLNRARTMAGYYLERTGWPTDLLQFNTGRVIPFDDFEAAELLYSYRDEETGNHMRLAMTLAPAGALLSMEVDYPDIAPADPPYIINSLRILVVIVFGFWVPILLYIRIRLRVIDIKSGILFAVLAGLAVPLFLILQWLHEQMQIPGAPGAIDIIWLVTTVGLSAALVSLVFFAITVIGESLTRQNWTEKIQTMDLIRIGHFFNLPVGTVFVHAVSFGIIMAAAWSAAFWLLPGAYISVSNTFFSDTTFFAPLVRILSIFFLCFITIQAVFLVLIGQISGSSKNKLILVLTVTAIFAIMIPVLANTGPIIEAMMLNGLVGFGLSIIYLLRDFLTTMLSYFVFKLLLVTADGWLMVNSPDIMIFYPAIGLLFVFLVYGFIATTRGKSVKELPRYVPDYIEDLAQEERIKQELQIARKVQQSFLPVRKPELEGIDLAAICIPAYETGGDYYDFISLNEQQLAITVGDVSGKGFQAAFYMTFIKGVLHALCLDHTSTVPILKKANKLFRENARRGTFISLIYGVIDLNKQEFKFSRAGHNPLLYYREKENLLKSIKPNGLALGMTDGKLFEDNIVESIIRLEKGDMLVLFTDGIVEAVDNNGQQYGDQRLERMVYFHHSKSAEEMVEQIVKDVEKFADGAKQHDDMTLLVIKQK